MIFRHLENLREREYSTAYVNAWDLMLKLDYQVNTSKNKISFFNTYVKLDPIFRVRNVNRYHQRHQFKPYPNSTRVVPGSINLFTTVHYKESIN